MRQRLALVGDENFENVEFFGREMDVVAADGYGAGFEVDGHFLCDEWGDGVAGRVTAERGTDAREKFFDAEGLGDVVVGAGVESGDFVALGVAHGEHDDGRVGGFADFAAGFEAADARHVHVEQDEVGFVFADGVDTFFAGHGFGDDVAVAGESGAHDAADLWFVVDDEDVLAAHRDSSCEMVSCDARSWFLADFLGLSLRCRAIGLLRYGQRERKNGAVAELAGDADGSFVRGDDGFGDREAHAGAADQIALIFAAIKLVENHGLFDVFDAGAAVGDAGGDGVAGLFGGDGDGLIFWRIEIGVVDELDDGFFDAIEIGGDWWEIVVDFDDDLAAGERGFGIGERGLDDVGNFGGLKIELDFAGFELGHFAGFFDEMIQAIALFVDDGEEFFALGWVGILGGQKAADGGFHRGERRAEVVGDGVEQGGFEALALALGFCLAELFDGARALDGDGDERADGFDGLAREQRAGNAEAADRADAETDWQEVDAGFLVHRDFVVDEGGLHFGFVELGVSETGAIELVFLREEEFGGAGFETFDDVVGDGVHELNDVTFAEEFAAEAVEAFDLAAAQIGFVGFEADAIGKLAAGDRDEKEDEKGDPVLWVGDGEQADRWEKEIVQREHGEDRHENGDGHAPDG